VASLLLLTTLAALVASGAVVADAAPARVSLPGSGMGDISYVDPAAATGSAVAAATAAALARDAEGTSGSDPARAKAAPSSGGAGLDPVAEAEVAPVEQSTPVAVDEAAPAAENPATYAEAEQLSPRAETRAALGTDTETTGANKTPELMAEENAKTMAHLNASDHAAFEKCVHDAGFDVSSREESLIKDIVAHSDNYLDNAKTTVADEASLLAYKIDQAKAIADCRASAIGGAIAGQVNNLEAKIDADKVQETAITCKKDIQTYIKEQTKGLFDGEIERLELLKRAKTAVQLASAALLKNTARAEARVVLAKSTLLNVQRQTALLKAIKVFLSSARTSLEDPELIANEDLTCEIKNKIKAEVLAVEDFASAVEAGKAKSAEALRVSNCIKNKTSIDQGYQQKNTFLEMAAVPVAPEEETAELVKKPCNLADALATLPSRQGQMALPANAPPADPMADSVEGTESMEVLVKTEISNLDDNIASALDSIKQVVHDHIEASAEEGRENGPDPTNLVKNEASLLQVANSQKCLKARAHAAHIVFQNAKSKTNGETNKVSTISFLSLAQTNSVLKSHLVATNPCADHVYDLLLEMEVQAGHRAATTSGAQAWALRARAAVRSGQRMRWRSDMYEKNPKKIDCDTAYKCKEKIEEKRKKDAEPKKGGFLKGLVNAVAGSLLGDTCVVCPDQLFLPAIKAYKMDEFTEKGPLGRTDAMERVQYRYVDPEEWDGKSGKHTFGSPDQVGQPCLPAIEDEFVMPCCNPKVNPITDGLITAGRPPFAMDDQIGQGAADDFLQVMEKKLRGERNRGKKTGGFVGSLGSVAAGAGAAAGVSIPYVPGSPFIKWNSENTFLGMNCCGGGPACCRWCPEQLCESLEMSSEKLEPLWWAVCSETDVSGNPSTRR
jgi:hypothetical protein